MSENPVKQRDVIIDRNTDKLSARGTSGRIIFGETGSYPDFSGLRWQTFQFEDIDASEKDGALGVLETNSRIPVELVKADKTFSEVPLTGDLLFLHRSNDGIISAYHFDSTRDNDSSFLFEVRKGDFFCWVNVSDQVKAEFLEYEEPGFTPDDLGIEELSSGRIAGMDIQIPEDFLNFVKQAEQTGIENFSVPVIELDIL